MKKAIIAAIAGAILMSSPVIAYSEDDLYELSHIINAKHELLVFRAKYSKLNELAKVFEAIDELG